MTVGPGTVTITPVTADRWPDLAELFGRGVVRQCACMWFRQTPAETKAGWDNGGNTAALHELVRAGREPGLLAYVDGSAVGWVSVGPREDFLPRLERSRQLKPAPGEGVWSVLCFWVKPGHRRAGLAAQLLDAAVAYARERGARAVEGVPVDPGAGRVDTGSAYTGVVGMFQAAGFTEIDRRGSRPIYRRTFPDSNGPETSGPESGGPETSAPETSGPAGSRAGGSPAGGRPAGGRPADGRASARPASGRAGGDGRA